MRPWIQALALVLLMGVPASAFAQPDDTAGLADEQFNQGVELMQKGDFVRALRFFRTSNSLRPTRGKLVNIAVCEARLGQGASALSHFLEISPPLAPDDRRFPEVKRLLDDLAPRVPHLRIDLAPGASAGTVVALDGVPVAASNLSGALPVDPGGHTVTVTSPGKLDRSYPPIRIAERQSLTIAVAPGAPAPVAPPPPPAPNPRKMWARYVMAAGGAVGLGGGVLLGLLARKKQVEMVPGQPTTVVAMAIGSGVLMGAGVTGLGAGGILWTRDGATGDGQKKAGVTVTVAGMPGGGAIGLAGRF